MNKYFVFLVTYLNDKDEVDSEITVARKAEEAKENIRIKEKIDYDVNIDKEEMQAQKIDFVEVNNKKYTITVTE